MLNTVEFKENYIILLRKVKKAGSFKNGRVSQIFAWLSSYFKNYLGAV